MFCIFIIRHAHEYENTTEAHTHIATLKNIDRRNCVQEEKKTERTRSEEPSYKRHK